MLKLGKMKRKREKGEIRGWKGHWEPKGDYETKRKKRRKKRK